MKGKESDEIFEEEDAPTGGKVAVLAASGIPVIIQNPVVHISTPETGSATTEQDVSCDIGRFELSPDQAVTEVTRFCGVVQVPGLLTESASVDFVINDTTQASWAPFVGKKVKVEVWESATDDKPREFVSYIGFNPGDYGTFSPGEALLLAGQALPVMSKITRGSAVPG